MEVIKTTIVFINRFMFESLRVRLVAHRGGELFGLINNFSFTVMRYGSLKNKCKCNMFSTELTILDD